MTKLFTMDSRESSSLLAATLLQMAVRISTLPSLTMVMAIASTHWMLSGQTEKRTENVQYWAHITMM